MASPHAVAASTNFMQLSYTARLQCARVGHMKNPIQNTSPAQLEELMMAMVGLETMAYIKPVLLDRMTHYAVFAADGTQLAVFEDHETAYFNAVKHNLAPVSIH